MHGPIHTHDGACPTNAGSVIQDQRVGTIHWFLIQLSPFALIQNSLLKCLQTYLLSLWKSFIRDTDIEMKNKRVSLEIFTTPKERIDHAAATVLVRLVRLTYWANQSQY